MSLVLWDIALVLLDTSIWMLLVYLVRSEASRLSRRGLYVLCMGMGMLLAAVYPFWAGWRGLAVSGASRFSFLAWLALLPVSFVVYPQGRWKNLFLLSAAAGILVSGSGFGNLAEVATGFGRPVNFLVRVVVDSLMLGALFLITRRSFPGLYESTGPRTWRPLAMVTLLLGVSGALTTGYVTQDTLSDPGFIPARLLLIFTRLGIFYIAGLAQRQAQESALAHARADAAEEAVRQKDDAYAHIVKGVEEAVHLRHDLRQMFTVIGGLNTPEQEPELEQYCLEALAHLQNTEQEVKRHEAL